MNLDNCTNEELDKLAALEIKKWTIQSFNTSYNDDHPSYADFYVDSRGDVVDRCAKFKPTIDYNESMILIDDLVDLGYYVKLEINTIGTYIRIQKSNLIYELLEMDKRNVCTAIVRTCLMPILKEKG